MIDDTPSPPRAGRVFSSMSSSFAAASASTQSWPRVEAAGKIAQQIERLGQHVIARDRLEFGNVERGQNAAQRDHAGAAGFAAGTRRRHHRVAGVEQHGAALLHVGVDARQRLRRRLRRVRHDRPIDQREEREFVARNVEADRFAGFERRVLAEEHA